MKKKLLKKKFKAEKENEEVLDENDGKGGLLLKILIIFVGVIIVLVALFIGVYFGCEIKTVTIKGNTIHDDEAVKRTILNDEYSFNAVFVYLKYKFNKPETMPFIDEMEVSLKSPTHIEIRVYEKKIIGYLYVEATGQYAYIDKDGVVVELSTEELPELALIRGIPVKDVVLYEALKTDNRNMYKNLLTITLTLSKYDVMPEVINFSSSRDIELIYGGVTVELGEAKYLNDKIVRLVEILPKLDGMTGVLHIEDYSEKNTDIIFEKDEE
ncbi:MAG: cell division protein FtsQ/DivIB [Lachnospiraceae bacterium]|nr:cell division protein FtsQ/DivIB [Lachnospiraceae bacterium]MBQ7708027.1 cell division protein FtsQ/DivIB [Lachnospiraceae bacterium]